jgi:hypothetical protein
MQHTSLFLRVVAHLARREALESPASGLTRENFDAILHRASATDFHHDFSMVRLA